MVTACISGSDTQAFTERFFFSCLLCLCRKPRTRFDLLVRITKKMLLVKNPHCRNRLLQYRSSHTCFHEAAGGRPKLFAHNCSLFQTSLILPDCLLCTCAGSACPCTCSSSKCRGLLRRKFATISSFGRSHSQQQPVFRHGAVCHFTPGPAVSTEARLKGSNLSIQHDYAMQICKEKIPLECAVCPAS